MSEEKNSEINEEGIKESSSSNENKNITIKNSTYDKLKIAAILAALIATFFVGFLFGNTGQDTNPDFVTKSDLDAMITKLESKIDSLNQPSPVRQPSQLSTPSIVKTLLDDDPFKGSPDAAITIVEFSDFQCPFCARFFKETLPQLEQNYIDTGKVKLVYRDLPLDNIHPNARPAHIAAECADEQGKFWEYHDVLFEKQSQWNRLSYVDLDSQLKQYAATLGLESSSFDSCLSSQDIADEVNADSLQASSYGTSGTPTFFIGNEEVGFVKLVGAQPYASFQEAIESHLG